MADERPQVYVVRTERGGPYDWSRGLREQDGWDDHASFMDALVDDRFVRLGGPLEGDRHALLVIDAPSEDALRARLAEDPWAKNGMLSVKSVERWTILLDGWAESLRDRDARGAMIEDSTVTTTETDLDVLGDLNRAYIDSVQGSDVARFRELLADDFLCSNPDGSLVDRDGFLEQTARPVTITGLQAQDVDIRILGNVAIIHGRTTYTLADGSPGSGRYTDVWERREGRWLAVAAHVTRN